MRFEYVPWTFNVSAMITLSVARSTKGNILRPHFIWTRDNRSAAGKERGVSCDARREVVEFVSFAVASILLSFPEAVRLGGNAGSLKNTLILCILIFL